ncbi:MAG TPA: ATP synthase F0 subunit B, partial [Bacteroidia bacterium]|nr:ATP synthase F0 subunit B [Bacteroidia bacterium]
MSVSFLLLLFILRKFAWKPILKMLSDRETSIAEA